jgi:hypothetical protein
LKISDDQLRESVEGAQLKLQRERGTNVTIFSPRAGGMAHHIGDATTSREWSILCNDTIHRLTQLYPKNFIGVCQLPQSPGVSPGNCRDELERCVKELGFVGCNLNPDPSGGFWTDPPLTDRFWYPIYEKMVELDVPAMIHVSASANRNFHATGAHYINGDTTAFMQFITGDLFKDFPNIRFIIPHGGGAVPYHWGPLPRPRAGPEAPSPARASAQRLLRHLRLPPGGHRPSDQGSAGREHPLCLGDGRRRARHRPRDRPPLRRHQTLHRRGPELERGGPAQDLRGQRAAGVSAARWKARELSGSALSPGCHPSVARRRVSRNSPAPP